LVAGSADRKKTLLISHLAGAMACGTTGRIFAFWRSAPFAGSAGILAGYFDFGLETEGCFTKRYLQIITEISASFRTAAAAASENIAESEKLAEYIPEIAKCSGIEAAESTLQPIVTIAVITCALIRIT
jgi:hypothetical protein